MMDWKQARTRLCRQHVADAARWIAGHCQNVDFGNLYQKTGCAPPRHRYATFEGGRFPAKAFGYLALQNAGWDRREDYRPTVNEVMNAVRRFGVRDVR
jgi:hypothetical protein